jgi:perosamine synthetase
VAIRLAGVGPGDLVIVPTLTFIAPVNAVRYLGADPVLLGCDDFMNLDPALLAAFCEQECEQTAQGLREKASGRRVAAVVPVHVFGNPCEMAAIAETAARFGLPVIEDASESLGSTWTTGSLASQHTGAIGAFGALSFNGNKIVTTGGGGVLLARDDADAERARYLVTQAKDDAVRYVHGDVGYNYRLSNVAAAIGVAQLEQLGGFIETKRRNRALYRSLLDGAKGVSLLGTPEGTSPNMWLYSLLVEPGAGSGGREGLMADLAARGIQTRPVWLPNHMQAPYRECRAYRVERAVWFWERVLNVPSGADLSEDGVSAVCAAIRSWAD